MRIYSVKRLTIPKIVVLAAGLAAAVMAATISPQAAVATPRASSCAGCHNPATAGVTTATPSTATPAPGASYTVAITLVANPNGGNTGYGIVPIAPASDKTFSLGTSPVAAGVATKSLTALGAGRYTYIATFIPTNAALFTTSASTAKTLVVTVPVTTPPVTRCTSR